MAIGRSVLTGKSTVAAGQRDRYVLIQQKPLPDDYTDGFPVANWTTLRYAWMSRRDLRADERFAARQESAFAETNWQCEYMRDMDPELVDVPAMRRIVYQGRTFDIVTATLMDRRSGIELQTLAGSTVPA